LESLFVTIQYLVHGIKSVSDDCSLFLLPKLVRLGTTGFEVVGAIGGIGASFKVVSVSVGQEAGFIKIAPHLRVCDHPISPSACETPHKYPYQQAIGHAHTTGENGGWGKTKQRSENQVAFNSVIWAS
jgi:hypothetical protein